MASTGPYDAIATAQDRVTRAEPEASSKLRGSRRPRFFVSLLAAAGFAGLVVAIQQSQSVSAFISSTLFSTSVISAPSDGVHRDSGRNSSTLGLATRAVRHEACLIYDKPYRTASTTISHALRSCWSSLRAHMRHDRQFAVDEDQSGFISNMLRSEFPIVALVGSHFQISEVEVNDLRTYCDLYIYITSTRSMAERLASEAKFHTAKSTVHTNYTLSRRQTQRAQLRVFERDWTGTELLYERYPFLEGQSGLKPGYIVRNQNFVHDLRALLNAFGCPSHFVSVNVHPTNQSVLDERSGQQDSQTDVDVDAREIEVDSKQLNLSAISLQFDDARHKRLSALAQRINKRGLKRARAIASLARLI